MPTINKETNDRQYNLSEEVYVITKLTEFLHINPRKGYEVGTKVRLINGVDNQRKLGYHFFQGYVTVCRVDATYAEFVGLPKEYLQLVIKEDS